jgi:hypothetical protein
MIEPNRYFHRVLKRLESKIIRFRDTISLNKSKIKQSLNSQELSKETTDSKELKIFIKVIRPESFSPAGSKNIPRTTESLISPNYPLVINPETFHKQFKVRRKSLLRRSHTPSNMNRSRERFSQFGLIFQRSPKNL